MVGTDGETLIRSTFVQSNISDALLDGARVYGVSAWDLVGTPASQRDLVITHPDHADVTVDNLRVAQFVYLLLENAEIRQVVDTVGQKGVLILGRFGDRLTLLHELRNRLRELGFIPIVFDFERPRLRDLNETVRVLAGLSAFVVADLTAPRSTPHEAQAVMSDYSVPFVPLIQAGEKPYAMFADLWSKYGWVMSPMEYCGFYDLLRQFDNAAVQPALQLREELTARKSRSFTVRRIGDYSPD